MNNIENAQYAGTEQLHPWWYFRFFEEIFAKTRNYSHEVSLIKTLFQLNGAVIREIGSGTGNHVAELLRCGISRIDAIDIDPVAITILRNRFALEHRVNVIQKDGFSDDDCVLFDLQLVYYCLIQQCQSSQIASERVSHMLDLARNGKGGLAIEVIDVDFHLYANLHKKPSEIYRGPDGYLEVETVETDFGMRIQYNGVLLQRSVRYSVPITRIDFAEIIDCYQQSFRFYSIPMSKSGRKKMVCFQFIG